MRRKLRLLPLAAAAIRPPTFRGRGVGRSLGGWGSVVPDPRLPMLCWLLLLLVLVGMVLLVRWVVGGGGSPGNVSAP